MNTPPLLSFFNYNSDSYPTQSNLLMESVSRRGLLFNYKSNKTDGIYRPHIDIRVQSIPCLKANTDI